MQIRCIRVIRVLSGYSSVHTTDIFTTELMEKPLPIIKVVGMSAAGKSTLVGRLREVGYDARPVSQEHSNMPELWRHFGEPAVLIFLNVSLEGQQTRRPDVAWTPRWHQQESERLASADGACAPQDQHDGSERRTSTGDHAQFS